MVLDTNRRNPEQLLKGTVMFTLIIIALVSIYVWFYYTNRKATKAYTGYAIGSTFRFVNQSAKAIALEAKLQKTKNTLEELEGEPIKRKGKVDGAKSADDLLASVGVDTAYFIKRSNELKEVQEKVKAIKAKRNLV